MSSLKNGYFCKQEKLYNATVLLIVKYWTMLFHSKKVVKQSFGSITYVEKINREIYDLTYFSDCIHVEEGTYLKGQHFLFFSPGGYKEMSYILAYQ